MSRQEWATGIAVASRVVVAVAVVLLLLVVRNLDRDPSPRRIEGVLAPAWPPAIPGPRCALRVFSAAVEHGRRCRRSPPAAAPAPAAVADHRLPWERPLPSARLTPARVHRGFATLARWLPPLAAAPKPCGRSPGRPKGRRSAPAARYPPVKKAA